MFRPITAIVSRPAVDWHDGAAGREDRPGIEPVTHRISAGPGQLAGDEGGGDRAPALLAPPTGFHRRIRGAVASRLIARGRTVFSFDFRGHGDSDAPDSDYSWHGFADDVFAVTEHLGLRGEPSLLAAGHSKGGAALVLAEAAHPGTYARLWLY